MKILCLQVRGTPLEGLSQVSGVSSYPDMLIDGPVDWLVKGSESIHEIQHMIEHQRPTVLVLQGETAPVWKFCLADYFPKLLMMTVDGSKNPEQIIDELNQRCWVVRHQRVKFEKNWPVRHRIEQDALFATLELGQRQQAHQERKRLEQIYKLTDLYGKLDTAAYEKTLYCLDLLEQTLDGVQWSNPPFTVLDVGTRQWSYACALSRYFKRHGQLRLTGIEIDPWFYDRSGTSHITQAHYYADLAQATFRDINFLELKGTWQVICHFLPLILPPNALRWRLPMHVHQPQALLQQTWKQLAVGGYALLYNGAHLEYQQTLYELQHLGIPMLFSRPHHCRLRQKQCGWVTVLQRPRFSGS